MYIWEKAIDVLNNETSKNYVYVSKNFDNLHRVVEAAKENCDVMGSTSNFVVVSPLGVAHYFHELAGVYYDDGSTTEAHLMAYCLLAPGAKIQKVNPETQEIIEDDKSA